MAAGVVLSPQPIPPKGHRAKQVVENNRRNGRGSQLLDGRSRNHPSYERRDQVPTHRFRWTIATPCCGKPKPLIRSRGRCRFLRACAVCGDALGVLSGGCRFAVTKRGPQQDLHTRPVRERSIHRDGISTKTGRSVPFLRLEANPLLFPQRSAQAGVLPSQSRQPPPGRSRTRRVSIRTILVAGPLNQPPSRVHPVGWPA